MYEVLILIHGNRFLMIKIRIKLGKKKSHSDQRNPDFYSVSFSTVTYLLMLMLLYDSVFHLL